MAKPSQQPRVLQQPSGRSSRSILSPDDANGQTPVWSIAIFDAAGPWGRGQPSETTLWSQIFPKLRNYESMTWGEIYRNKKRDHSVAVSGIVKVARERLVTLKLDDLDELFRFRLSGTMRVWGIREGRVFRILWWDPDHEVWPVEPK